MTHHGRLNVCTLPRLGRSLRDVLRRSGAALADPDACYVKITLIQDIIRIK
jgi:hypothetical protein